MKNILSIFYRNYKHLGTLPLIKVFLYQKCLGFNRKVPWPVHWSSTVYAHHNIDPGSRSPGFSKYCHIDGRNGVVFGDNIWIGPFVKIISMNHDVNNYQNYVKQDPIYIKDNCWIGAGATILPGVVLGKHTIVAAGAVVTESFTEGNLILGGVPAKIIKKLDDYEIS